MSIVLDEELLNTGRIYGLDDDEEKEDEEKDFDGEDGALDDDLLPDVLDGDLLGADTEEDDPFSSGGDFKDDEEDDE